MFTTRAVSQSARLLLKSAAPSNKDCVVLARDTSHLAGQERQDRQESARVSYKQSAQQQPPRRARLPCGRLLPGACAATWLFRTRRPRRHPLKGLPSAFSMKLSRWAKPRAKSYRKDTRVEVLVESGGALEDARQVRLA